MKQGWVICLAVLALGGCAAPIDENVEHTQLAASTSKVLAIDYQIQQTGYWCGPAATRMALSARISPPSQATLASQLGTTTNGTDWIGQITSVLNRHLGYNWYKTVEMPNDPPTAAQEERLWNDVVTNIDNNYPIVANIVAPADNHPPGYPGYTVWHYFTVIGYDAANGRRVYIADSANFSGYQKYWLSFHQLATLIPPKGYSAGTGTPMTPTPPAPTGCGEIALGTGLTKGSSFASCDNRFSIAMQTDGNLVLYKGTTAKWASNTTGGYVATMQPDGNFVLYGPYKNALWSSNTWGKDATHLKLQDDGNLVVYKGPTALWATNTNE